jgi:hypothetical protein
MVWRGGPSAYHLSPLLIMLPGTAAAAPDRPYRIGIVLPGDHWASSIDGLREGDAAAGVRTRALVGTAAHK